MAFQLDPRLTPALVPRRVEEDDDPGFFEIAARGLARGAANVAGMAGSAVEGFGRLTGIRAVENVGDFVNDTSNKVGNAVGIPDLDVAPWREGGASTGSWLTYQLANQLPVLATYMAGSRAVQRTGMAPQSLARVGERAPAWLGGGRGMAPAQAQAAGQRFSANVTGTMAVGAPMGFGSMYQEAETAAAARGEDRASWGDAATALVASPAYAAMDALDLNILRGAGMGPGGFIKRVLTGGARAGVMEMPQEGIQTAMEMGFRDDLSAQQKMDAIVDASLTGGAVGGVLGAGSASIRRQQRVAPGDDTQTIEAKVDQALERLALPAPAQPGGPQMGGSDTLYADSQGVTSTEPGTNFERGFGGRREFEEVQPAPPVGPQDELSQQALSTQISQLPDASLSEALERVNTFFQGRSFESLNEQEQQIAAIAGEMQGELQRRYEAALAERERSGARVAGLLPLPPLRLPAPPDFQTDSQGTTTPRERMDLSVTPPAPVYERKADRNAEMSYPTVGAALNGISTRKAYRDLADLPMNTVEQRQAGKDAVRARLVERLEDGSAAAGDFKLAERLGIDANAAQSRPIESEGPAPTNQEVDPTFQQSWQQALQGRTGRMATRLERNLAPNIDVARRQIYDLMGSNDFRDPNADTQYAQLQALAVELGVQDQQGSLTDIGMAVARQALPDTLVNEAAAEAKISDANLAAFAAGARGTKANARGFKGQGALAFKRGQMWAQNRRAADAPIPETLPASETQAVMERVGRGEIPQRVRDVQAVNNLIDAQFGGLGDAATAQLRRMARGGATEAEVTRAAAQLRANPNVTLPGLTAAPARPTQRANTAGRGQPRFREEGQAGLERAERQRKNEVESLRHTIRTLRDTDNISTVQFIKLTQALRRGDLEAVRRGLPGRARPMFQGGNFTVDTSGGALISATNPIQSRADWVQVMSQQAALERQIAETQQRMEQAATAGDQSAADRAWQRVMELRGELADHRDQWDDALDQWDDVMAGRISEVEAKGGRNIADDSQRTDAETFAFESAYRGATMDEAVDALVRRSKGGNKVVAQRIKATLKRLQSAGFKFKFHLVQAGDQVPQEMNWAQGLSSINGKQVDVWIAGSTARNPGTLDEVVMHEMVHAVTQATIDAGVNQTKHGQAVKELEEVTSFLQAHLRNREQVVGREGLTEFEQRVANRDNNALDDAHEVLAWAMADADMQAYLQSVEYAPRQTLWQRIVNAIKSILGMPSNSSTSALEAVMRASEGIMGVSVADARRIGFTRNPTLVSAMIGGSSPQAINERMKQGASQVTNAAKRLRWEDLTGKARKTFLGWEDRHSMVQRFTALFRREAAPNPLAQYDTAHNERSAMIARLSQLAVDPGDAFQALRRKNAESAKLTEEIMAATQFGFDPSRAWKDQHVSVLSKDNAAELKALHAPYYAKYRTLQARGHTDVYTQMRVVNDLQSLSTSAVQLHNHVSYSSAKALPEFASNPMDDFMAAQTKGQMDAEAARAWWDQRLTRQEAALNQWLAGQRTSLESRKADPGIDGLRKEVQSVSEHIASIRQNRTAMEAAPYFHLGRYGNYIVNFDVTEGNLGAVGDALLAAGFDATLTQGNESKSVFVRLESITEQANMLRELEKLGKRGLVAEGSVKDWVRSSETLSGMSALSPDWVQRVVERLNRSDSLSAEDKKMMVDDLVSYSLDLLPDNASVKMLTKRQNRPGFSTQMARSFDLRSQVWVNSLAGLTSSSKVNEALRGMREATREARDNQRFTPQDKEAMQQVLDELTIRETERHNWKDTPGWDKFSAFTTAWYLGFSPSYGLVNMTSLVTMVLPELGSKHGFSKAFGSLRRAMPIALKIMKEVAKHGWSISATRAQDAIITFDVLERASGQKTAEYLMQVANRGILDIGGMTRELARGAEGRTDSWFDNSLRYAGAIGYYTETFSRLVTALASRDLDSKLSLDKQVDNASFVIADAMFNYNQTNQGRQFTKSGFAGNWSPLMFKFMQYPAQYTGKLYREVYDAIKGPTEQSKRDARRFLRQHLATMTVTAGALGLPFVTALAAVVDSLGEWWDDDDIPNDIRASFRAYLTDVVGQDLATVATNGIGTAAGFDISRRVGMQDLLPFSRWLDDRRVSTTAFSELTSRALGAPVSLIASFAEGAQKLGNGDYLGAMDSAMPTALRGFWQSYQLTANGFKDRSGREYAQQPGTMAILWQLAGFQPTEMGRQRQRNQTAARYESVLRADKTVITNQLIRALESGDDDTAQTMIARAQAFDQSNPSEAILPTIEQTIRRRRRDEARSAASGLPFTANERDENLRALLDY